MEIYEAKEILYDVYRDVNGGCISSEERSRRGHSSKNFVYGEINPDSSKQIFDIIRPQEGELFCDLGSGVGKNVLFLSLIYPFSKLYGIEILENLSKESKKAAERLYKKVPKDYKLPKIEFINANFLHVDFSNMDVLYACSTCFSEDLMLSIAKNASLMKKNSKVITLTKELPSTNHEKIFCEQFPMSWGNGTVNIFRKI